MHISNLEKETKKHVQTTQQLSKKHALHHKKQKITSTSGLLDVKIKIHIWILRSNISMIQNLKSGTPLKINMEHNK